MQTYLNIILNRQIGKQTDILEGTGDTHAVYLRGILSRGIDAVEQDGSVCRLIYLCEQVENGGLSCAVRSDKSCDLGSADDEVKVVYRHESPELYTEMAALEHGCFIEIALGNYRAARERDHIDLSFFKR